MDFGNGLENNFHHSKILYTQNFYDILLHVNGLIAQLVEQRSPKPRAEGSIPSAPARVLQSNLFRIV